MPAENKIRGSDLDDLIDKVRKLPKKPVGTMCTMVQTSRPSDGGNGYSWTLPIVEGLYVQCFGECKKKGEACQPFIVSVAPADELYSFVIGCDCGPPRKPKKGKIKID